MARYEGGYLIHNHQLIRTGLNAHTNALKDPVSPVALKAINAIQETAWRINGPVLDVMQDLWAAGAGVAKMPSAEPHRIPDKMPDEAWNMLTEDERKVVKMKVAKLHTENAKLASKRDSLLRKLEIARTMRDEEAIYFPHTFDFRYRIYPIPQDLNPQSDDLGKGLLMFAEGKPITLAGIYWLKVHAANCAGEDKLSLRDRIRWVNDNLGHILASAANPLDYLWWAEVAEGDDPFCFLAACFELSMVEEFGESHISHLPIQVDGTCNGLQHLSALGKDRKGAVATNVAANEEREDIYMQVATHARGIVAEDVARGNEEAAAWAGKVTRDVVKRGVMTTPYGVTHRGIRDQLVDDGHTAAVVGDEWKNHKVADYMTTVIQRSVTEVVSSASEIMGYLQELSSAMTKRGLPTQWKNAAGCTVQQSYYGLSETRVQTLFGGTKYRTIVFTEDENQNLNKRRQRNGMAPNYIHSQDAAHMALTVDLCVDVFGLSSFSMIHDSYGTHACNMPKLNAAIRATFSKMYEGDVLGEFHKAQMEVAEPLGIELPEPPDRGDFDVSEVTESAFFFA